MDDVGTHRNGDVRNNGDYYVSTMYSKRILYAGGIRMRKIIIYEPEDVGDSDMLFEILEYLSSSGFMKHVEIENKK